MSSTSDGAAVNPSADKSRRRRPLRLLFLIFVALPVAFETAFYALSDHPASWRQANWSSSGLLPPAADDPPARIMVFAARNGTWRSIFAVHTWIVVKPQNGVYTRYEVTGFGMPVRVNAVPPDGYWFSNRPVMIADIRGPQAAEAIPKIIEAVNTYAYARFGDYRIWPGPNSNTFVATVLRAVPELGVAMPSTAIGKDFRADNSIVGWTPSETGIEFDIFGLLGLKVGWVEGVELNLFTLVTGLDIRHPALKLPAIGRIDLDGLITGMHLPTLH